MTTNAPLPAAVPGAMCWRSAGVMTAGPEVAVPSMRATSTTTATTDGGGLATRIAQDDRHDDDRRRDPRRPGSSVEVLDERTASRTAA